MRLALLYHTKLVEVQLSLSGIELADGEDLLEVDPASQIVRHKEVLLLGLLSKCLSIVVAAREEDKLRLEHALLAKPGVELSHGLSDIDTSVDLLLCDAGRFRAESSQLRILGRLHVGVEDRLDLARLHIEKHDWELNDLVYIYLALFTLTAGALEVHDADVVDRSLVHKPLGDPV